MGSLSGQYSHAVWSDDGSVKLPVLKYLMNMPLLVNSAIIHQILFSKSRPQKHRCINALKQGG